MGRHSGYSIILTNREKEALELYAQGLGHKEISIRLHIAMATTKRTLKQARGKLGASNSAHAVTIAIQSGELKPNSPEIGNIYEHSHLVGGQEAP